jgi:hypothetical protein
MISALVLCKKTALGNCLQKKVLQDLYPGSFSGLGISGQLII